MKTRKIVILFLILVMAMVILSSCDQSKYELYKAYPTGMANDGVLTVFPEDGEWLSKEDYDALKPEGEEFIKNVLASVDQERLDQGVKEMLDKWYGNAGYTVTEYGFENYSSYIHKEDGSRWLSVLVDVQLKDENGQSQDTGIILHVRVE